MAQLQIAITEVRKCQNWGLERNVVLYDVLMLDIHHKAREGARVSRCCSMVANRDVGHLREIVLAVIGGHLAE